MRPPYFRALLPSLFACMFTLSGCGKTPKAPTPGPKEGSLFLHRNDIKAHTVHVPTLKSDACIPYIEAAFRKKDGTRAISDPHRAFFDISADLDRNHVTVAYNSLVTSSRNVEHIIADAGFAVRSMAPLPRVESYSGPQADFYDIPANKAAFEALPKACQ